MLGMCDSVVTPQVLLYGKSKLAAFKIVHRNESFELAEEVYMKLERLYGKASRGYQFSIHCQLDLEFQDDFLKTSSRSLLES